MNIYTRGLCGQRFGSVGQLCLIFLPGYPVIFVLLLPCCTSRLAAHETWLICAWAIIAVLMPLEGVAYTDQLLCRCSRPPCLDWRWQLECCSPSDLYSTLKTVNSLHHASEPHGEWAWDLCELFLWQWQSLLGCHLTAIPLFRFQYTFPLPLFFFFFSFWTVSCDPVCDFHTILLMCLGETELLEQVSAKRSHQA